MGTNCTTHELITICAGSRTTLPATERFPFGWHTDARCNCLPASAFAASEIIFESADQWKWKCGRCHGWRCACRLIEVKNGDDGRKLANLEQCGWYGTSNLACLGIGLDGSYISGRWVLERFIAHPKCACRWQHDNKTENMPWYRLNGRVIYYAGQKRESNARAHTTRALANVFLHPLSLRSTQMIYIRQYTSHSQRAHPMWHFHMLLKSVHFLFATAILQIDISFGPSWHFLLRCIHCELEALACVYSKCNIICHLFESIANETPVRTE